MILRNATIKYSGYDPELLKPKSNKRICVSCDVCGRVRWQRFSDCTKLCRLCNNKCETHRKKVSVSRIGKKHTKETKQKISKANKGKKFSDEHRKNISKSLKGKKKSNNERKEMSERMKGKNNSNYGNGDKIKGSNNPNWKGGITNQPYCHLWTEDFREMIRERFHYKCFICNGEQDRKLSVHHVNYNKNCLCGSVCEFIPLCQSCHSKTNFNRQYWENLIMNYLYPNRYFMSEI